MFFTVVISLNTLGSIYVKIEKPRKIDKHICQMSNILCNSGSRDNWDEIFS